MITVSRCRRHPRVITGDEIRPVGATLKPGEIHDSNGPMIGAGVAALGYRRRCRSRPRRCRRGQEHAGGAPTPKPTSSIIAGGASVATTTSARHRPKRWACADLLESAQKPPSPCSSRARQPRSPRSDPQSGRRADQPGPCTCAAALDCWKAPLNPAPPGTTRAWHKRFERDSHACACCACALDHARRRHRTAAAAAEAGLAHAQQPGLGPGAGMVPVGDEECAAGTVLRWTALRIEQRRKSSRSACA